MRLLERFFTWLINKLFGNINKALEDAFTWDSDEGNPEWTPENE